MVMNKKSLCDYNPLQPARLLSAGQYWIQIQNHLSCPHALIVDCASDLKQRGQPFALKVLNFSASSAYFVSVHFATYSIFIFRSNFFLFICWFCW